MRKERMRDRIFHITNGFFLSLLAVMMIYPLYYVLAASVSDYRALMQSRGLLIFPDHPTFEAYKMALRNPMILKGFQNTLFVVVVGVAVNLLLTAIGAYFLSRKGVKLQKAIMILIVITMYFSGGMIPFYFTVKDFHLDGSLWALIFPTAVNTFNLIIMRVSFAGIPDSLEESAKLDGAGHFVILFRVILPLSKATIAVIGLYYAVGHWNAWFNAMLFLDEREKYPIQLVLREILIQNQTSDLMDSSNYSEASYMSETIKYAIIVMSTFPILCVYPFLQKYFVKGVLVGSVKG